MWPPRTYTKACASERDVSIYNGGFSEAFGECSRTGAGLKIFLDTPENESAAHPLQLDTPSQATSFLKLLRCGRYLVMQTWSNTYVRISTMGASSVRVPACHLQAWTGYMRMII